VKRKNAAVASAASTSAAPAASSSAAAGWGTGSGTAYRDRTAERREVHHQPDRPSPADLAALHTSRKKFEGPRKPSPPPAPAVAPGQDESNVGNQLLAKMGWKEGTGLGLSGEGRVDPINVKQFDSRVGLGKTQGRDPAAWDGPGGLQRRALDMVRASPAWTSFKHSMS
jgi:RNA-binding protein 5/10